MMEENNKSNETSKPLQDIKQEPKKAKEPKKSTTDKSKKSLKTKFDEVMAEFNKIIWPSKEQLTKQTITVIIVSIMFGILISFFDYGYSVIFGLLN